ncbi:hypothetical protein SBOR_2120 [Sclerotinia borealis F-4128]|uniref:Uncharacterized protein n=1 Tax=Sclerotinia borealis (strain F-4128) TaxID=1432307 RepID=W9CNL7_SCLBF|nr:hypothetical protein SBOR_2120 [Sclerotinia borealis F-4128]
MMILQGHRSNSESSDDKSNTFKFQQANRFPRRNTVPWAREPPFTSYRSEREANPTPFNTMFMPRLDSSSSQEPRSHIPIWEPLYMEDTPTSTPKKQGGKRKSGISMETNASKQQLESNFFDDADIDGSSVEHGCCSWKLCLSFFTANWMSRAM